MINPWVGLAVSQKLQTCVFHFKMWLYQNDVRSQMSAIAKIGKQCDYMYSSMFCKEMMIEGRSDGVPEKSLSSLEKSHVLNTYFKNLRKSIIYIASRDRQTCPLWMHLLVLFKEHRLMLVKAQDKRNLNKNKSAKMLTK